MGAFMVDQDAQDITQMNPELSEVPVVSAKPRKSYLLWIVLSCVVVGVGLGVFVYQRSLAPVAIPSPTPRPTVAATQKPSVVASPLASPLASPIKPGINLVEAVPNTVTFPKAGNLRIYYGHNSLALGVIVTNGGVSQTFQIPAGSNSTTPTVYDTNYAVTAGETLTITSYLGTNSSQLSIGWADPVSNKCGFNGFSIMDIAPELTLVTQQSGSEPIVSVQCWGDYSPNPKDTSALDFNDFVLFWSYTPSSASVSPSPSASATDTPSPSPSASATDTPSPSPSPSISPSPSPSPSSSSDSTVAAAATPTPSARAAMPDTTNGMPVTGVFEVTVGTVSVGLIFLVLGLFGLLAL